MSNVAVMTDSAASLPPALAKKWGVTVVALEVVVDGQALKEGEDISPAEVLEHLENGTRVSTSQPNLGAFQQAFQEAADAGAQSIVAVLISATMSGTVNVARAAALHSQIPVEVVDTGTLAMATGYAAVAAGALAARGASTAEVANRARNVAASALCVFTVDTLEYLKRGGRISPAVAAIGTALSMRPVMAIESGAVVVLERVRTTHRARAAMLARVDQRIEAGTHPAVAIMALGEEKYGDDAAQLIESRHPGLSLLVRTPVSAVLSAHTGPGTLAAVVVDMPGFDS